MTAGVQVLGSAVVIEGAALGPLYQCVLAGVREARRNGYSISPYVAIQAATFAAYRSMSGVGHQHSGEGTSDGQSNSQGDDDLLSIAEAAALSGYCERQVRRKARAGQGRRVGNAWVLPRGAALALKQEREWKERNGSRRVPTAVDAQAR